MTREIVSASGAPAAVGPYSQAVRAGGFVFCSGQIPLDPATGELCAGSIEEATERCLLNLQEVLRAAGPSDVDPAGLRAAARGRRALTVGLAAGCSTPRETVLAVREALMRLWPVPARAGAPTRIEPVGAD